MKYLFIGAHVDDVQLSCGGTIAQLVKNGHEVTVCSFTRVYGELNLLEEFDKSLKELGVDTYHLYDMETRQLARDRQKVLDKLFNLEMFDYVFTQSNEDFHQDHVTVAKETIRRYKHTNILSYVGCWNTRKQVKNYFVTLNGDDVMKKLHSVEKFESQKGCAYMTKEAILSEMRINGLMCGDEFAEAFEVVNMIV